MINPLSEAMTFPFPVGELNLLEILFILTLKVQLYSYHQCPFHFTCSLCPVYVWRGEAGNLIAITKSVTISGIKPDSYPKACTTLLSEDKGIFLEKGNSNPQ